jgi:hypothetical protein
MRNPLVPSHPDDGSEFLLYQTEDGQTRVQVQVLDETVWLSQRLLAELFQKSVPTINEHIQSIYAEGELDREATIRNFRIVQIAGAHPRYSRFRASLLPEDHRHLRHEYRL